MTASEQLARNWIKAQPAIAGFISTMVPDFAKAQDLLQEVAVIVVRKFHLFDETQSSFLPWALGIAKFEVLSYRRSLVKKPMHFSSDLVDQIAKTCENIEPELAPIQNALRKCLHNLEGRSKDIMSLRYEHNLAPSAIAYHFGTQVGSIRTRLHRIRNSLRQCIQKHLKLPEK